MFGTSQKLAAASFFLLSFVVFLLTSCSNQSSLPVIAIANYGPHASLDETIQGIKEELDRLGYREGEQICFKVSHVNFESILIPQMLGQLKRSNPRALVTLTTPVAQAAKGSIKDIPLIFSNVTDPEGTGLGQEAGVQITGASDKQDLKIFLKFARQLLPHVKRVGIFYGTGEANDLALLKMFREVASAENLEVVAIPIDNARDIPQRMQLFRGKVDLIYVGMSGPIQPSLPAIVAEADRMQIPVFNGDADAVRHHLALGSYGVSYYQVGVNTAKLIARILDGERAHNLPILYPVLEDYRGYISKRKADKLGIPLAIKENQIQILE